jgi:hypothetical protein
MGVSALHTTYYFNTSRGLVIWDLTGFGWLHIVLGCVMILTAFGLFAHATLARWVAVALAAMSAISEVFWLVTTPFWSLTIIALDVLIIYGLVVGWSRVEAIEQR